MNWQVFSRPEAENDVIEIAAWYDSRREGLGDRFVEEFLAVLDELAINLCSIVVVILVRTFDGAIQRAFPIESFYEALEQEKIVVVAAVLHAARHDREWKRRL